MNNTKTMMRLTLINRLKLCIEILAIRSGHNHAVHEKQLSTFQRGYDLGLDDGKYEHMRIKERCAQRAEEVAASLPHGEVLANIRRAVLNA